VAQIAEMYANTHEPVPYHAYLWMPVIGAGSTLQFQALTQMLSFFPTVSVHRISLLELRTALPFRFQLTTRQLESVHRHWDTTATTATITTTRPATPLHTLLLTAHLVENQTPAHTNIHIHTHTHPPTFLDTIAPGQPFVEIAPRAKQHQQQQRKSPDMTDILFPA
jgi:hypothetical protein